MTVALERRLTPEQRLAAFLDARGYPRDEIARLVGVHKVSISRWRRQEPVASAYRAEVERVHGLELDRLEELYVQVRLEKIEALRRAIGTALEALEALDEEGRPLWIVRLAALKALGLTDLDVRPVTATTDDERGSGPLAQAAVIVVQRRGDELVIEGGEIDADRS